MEKERAQHEGELWGRVFRRENLKAALERVKQNKGAPGVDGMTVEELSDHLKEYWPSIRTKLETGTYRPSPVKRVEISKPGGGQRKLGIPTVLDRMIQQALQQVLSEEFEGTFSEHSYGFRPGRSAHDAVEAARGYIEAGYQWTVDIDLEKFFDTVHHDRLMARMKAKIADKRVLRLVNEYLKAGVMVDGVVVKSEEGAPQGSPLSPLLSNIVLSELDEKLAERGHRFVRYADDCNIYVKSERAAKRVMESTSRFIERRMRLKVNAKKSAIGRAVERQFLGFSFYYRRAGGVRIRISCKSLERVKRRIRQLTQRNQGRSWYEIKTRLEDYIRGWVHYYALADAMKHMIRLDEWLRRRMRQLAWKQWKTPKNRRQNLRSRGISEYWAKRVGGSSLGPWRLSMSFPVKQALSNAYWQKVGLPSFKTQYQLRHT